MTVWTPSQKSRWNRQSSGMRTHGSARMVATLLYARSVTKNGRAAASPHRLREPVAKPHKLTRDMPAAALVGPLQQVTATVLNRLHRNPKQRRYIFEILVCHRATWVLSHFTFPATPWSGTPCVEVASSETFTRLHLTRSRLQARPINSTMSIHSATQRQHSRRLSFGIKLVFSSTFPVMRHSRKSGEWLDLKTAVTLDTAATGKACAQFWTQSSS
mmetsp:Transcript_97251/g.187480  ORF Transcript_97251/g.187480 Transcript_97251/m.187480 type:complete len:216 (+) Transcript_97251:523-1170(+)